MDNKVINKDSTTASETSASITYTDYCSYRLPCGLCRLTNSQCPKAGTIVNPTYPWISPTVYCASVPNTTISTTGKGTLTTE